MTVVYTYQVATGSRGLGNFGKLLLIWTGSIYKLVLPDLCVYIVLYYMINISYRTILQKQDHSAAKDTFHMMVEYSAGISKVLPLQFVLGFYVSQIVTRWWSQFMTIPWPDTLALSIATSVRGHDDRGRLMRRTIIRYVNTTLVMVFTMMSPQARARFPSLDHLVESGFLVPHEKLIIEHLNEKSEGPKYFVPIVWAAAVAAKARKEGRIKDDVALYQIIKELCKFRTMAGDLLSYDWVNIPLVYTQVATLCTYLYFGASLMGKQLYPSEDKLDLYVPIFHFLEFFFLMGWLKVAETMINPFGEDDDDFELNWLVDRNMMVSYMIVDEMNAEFPEMLRDAYWDGVVPDELPYTQEALRFKTDGMGQGSAALHHKERDDDKKTLGGNASTNSVVSGPGMKTRFSLPFHLTKHEHRQHQHQHRHPSTQFPQKSTTSIPTYAHLLEKSFEPKLADSREDLAE